MTTEINVNRITYTKDTSISTVALSQNGNKLYFVSGTNLTSFNTIDGTIQSTNGTNFNFYNQCEYNGNIYTVDNTTINMYNIAINITSQFKTSLSVARFSTTGTCIINPYLYYVGYNTTTYVNTIIRVNITNSSDISYSWFSYTAATILSMTGYNGNIYAATTSQSPILRISITNPTTDSGNFISKADPTLTGSGVYGITVYNGSLYCSIQTGCINRYSLIDASYETPYVSTKPYVSTSDTGNLGSVCGITINNGNLWAITYASKKLSRISMPPPPPPSNISSLDQANTMVVASGNLRVSIVDPSNTLANGVYYEYSVNGNGYVNTNVYAGTSPNTLYVLSSDISNTILIRAKNVSGNSTPISVQSNLSIIYQTPRAPPTPTFTIVGSGNVQVSINESTITPAPYYYLNNVSYYLYAYNTFGGTNLSGNTSTLVYNQPVGVLSNTNSTYSQVVSYVNTGLNANTYTMYVIARNNFGNSTPVSANIAVFTTPVSPTIDTVNTQSTTSGNLTVFIQDASNSSTNGVYYLYSMDGINYGNSGVAKTSATTYQFTINNTGNAQVPLTAGTYTLRVAASNAVGNSISSPATAPEIVYTTPVSPTIDTVNTQSTTSGNLTVFITDTVNSPVNGVYYLYSMDGINYGNSRAFRGANTTTIFTISNTGNAQVPLTAGTYTLRIAATNSVGNSISSPATAIESVYTTPLPPIIDTGNTKSITSGNVNVAFTDPSNNVNNSVEYTYFMYDPSAASLFYV
jgi:hypothetical protein